MKTLCNFNQFESPAIQQKGHTIFRVKTSLKSREKRENNNAMHFLEKNYIRFSQGNNQAQNLEDQNKTLSSYTRKTSIKLKLLRAKKRTIKTCYFGIGYQNKHAQFPNQKISQQFFPQRTLTVFKKLAFKSWNERLSNDKTSYQKLLLQINSQKNSSKIRLRRHKSSLEINNPIETQLKIISFGQNINFKPSKPQQTANKKIFKNLQNHRHNFTNQNKRTYPTNLSHQQKQNIPLSQYQFQTHSSQFHSEPLTTIDILQVFFKRKQKNCEQTISPWEIQENDI